MHDYEDASDPINTEGMESDSSGNQSLNDEINLRFRKATTRGLDLTPTKHSKRQGTPDSFRSEEEDQEEDEVEDD